MPTTFGSVSYPETSAQFLSLPRGETKAVLVGYMKLRLHFLALTEAGKTFKT